MPIEVYNTLTRRKEELVPRDRGKISMYVCGPTVYGLIHIGNGRTLISFDIIYRYLTYKGYQVTYLRNITDVDDKIIAKANEEGVSADEIARRYTTIFEEDAARLSLAEPTLEPKATEHIPAMVAMVEGLIKRGLAYVVDGDVYFSVDKFPEYGRLSHRSLDEMRAGERVEVDPRKKNPMDFALWKSAKRGEPAWDSPWGRGRPGWHIECSSMSLKYLGLGFDIHGGGQDLIFPHHENELAQAEGYAGQGPFVRYWLHAGMVNIGEEKMAKSLGNIVLVHDLLERYNPNVLRLLAVSTHYRSPLDYGVERLKEATASYERFLNFARAVDQLGPPTAPQTAQNQADVQKLREAVSRTKEDFVRFMDDDFNSPAALASIFELVRETNGFVERHEEAMSPEVREAVDQAYKTVIELTGVFGLDLTPPEKKDLAALIPEAIFDLAHDVGLTPAGKEKKEVVDEIIARRETARQEKDWSLADKIRHGLGDLGIEIEDTPHGPRWKLRESLV